MADEMRGLRLKVLPDTYNLIRVNTELWSQILSDPSLSPRMSVPFMIFKTESDFLLLLDDADAMGIKSKIPRDDFESGTRVIEVRSTQGLRDPNGFNDLVRAVLAGGISVRCISSWDADFVVISQDELGSALKLLSPFIEELC